MKRASYRLGVEWMAMNDSAGDLDALDPEIVASYISAILLADLFGVGADQVGADVVRCRKKLRRAGEL